MAYDPSVPASGQSLGETRATIQGNFADINTAFSVNHSPLTGSTDGKHLFLQMPEQTSAPTTAADEGAVYTKDASGTNLFFRTESDGAEIQLTNVVGAGGSPGANPGYTFLPGGVIMQWGRAATGGAGSGTTAFGFSFPTSTFKVFMQSFETGAGTPGREFNVTAFTTADFSWKNSQPSSHIDWMALGK